MNRRKMILTVSKLRTTAIIERNTLHCRYLNMTLLGNKSDNIDLIMKKMQI